MITSQYPPLSVPTLLILFCFFSLLIFSFVLVTPLFICFAISLIVIPVISILFVCTSQNHFRPRRTGSLLRFCHIKHYLFIFFKIQFRIFFKSFLILLYSVPYFSCVMLCDKLIIIFVDHFPIPTFVRPYPFNFILFF